MFFNCLAVGLIILLMLYLATQGLLSATMALITAVFASVLTMAIFEPLQSIVANHRPDYGRGVTFLLVFFLSLSGLRILSDMVVPKNIPFPNWVDRIAGAAVGFFAAMTVIGTTIIGVEMFPVSTTLLGYDRYPLANRMQAVQEVAGKPIEIPAKVAAQESIWLSPDRFVLTLWNMVSARGFGGSIAFSQVHPDLSAESYGYRNVVEQGSSHAVLRDLVKVPGVYKANDPADLKRFHLPETGMQAIVLRTEIEQGIVAPLVSYDDGGYFRITPTQIRMVTDHGRQYYPVGYLLRGQTFVPTSLSTGVLVEDYPATLKIVHDWVFPLAEDEKPLFVEVKQLARFNIAQVPGGADLDKTPRFGALAKEEYPPRAYRENPATVNITLERINPDKSRTPISNADVYVVFNTIQQREVATPAAHAYDALVDNLHSWNNNEKGWGDHLNTKSGVPQKYALEMNLKTGRDEVKLKDPADHIQWSILLPLLLYGEMTTDGPRNLEAVNRYFDDTVVPLLTKSATGKFYDSGKTGTDGKYTVKLSAGTYTYIIRSKSPDLLGIWIREFSIAPKAVKEEFPNTDNVDFKVDMRLKK